MKKCIKMLPILALVFIITASSQWVFSNNNLKMNDRITCQKAIEQVYWNNRIWPEYNKTKKPSLKSILPDKLIKEKVEDVLKKSNALELYWNRPITGEQLQIEMDRMAKYTKQPRMLRELWKSINNDPHKIAECLASPLLADRLIRN